jgi:hypothetical protein
MAGTINIKALSDAVLQRQKAERNAERPVEQAEKGRNDGWNDLEKTECDSCPAAATWDYGPYRGKGRLCFYDAYFQGKAGKPAPCSIVKCQRYLH